MPSILCAFQFQRSWLFVSCILVQLLHVHESTLLFSIAVSSFTISLFFFLMYILYTIVLYIFILQEVGVSEEVEAAHNIHLQS